MRERVEDLGRIAVLIDRILNMDLFRKHYEVRPKDFCEIFFKWPAEQQMEFIRTLPYDIGEVRYELEDVLGIAEGKDHLNEDLAPKWRT